MTTKDIPDEYMHCFNIMDEIPRYDPMEIEHQVGNIVETVNLEWHYWENGEPDEKKKQEPSLKKLLNLADYETARKEENKKQQTENSEPNEPSIESGSKGDKKKKRKAKRKSEVHTDRMPLNRSRNCWILSLNRAFQHVRLDLLWE